MGVGNNMDAGRSVAARMFSGALDDLTGDDECSTAGLRRPEHGRPAEVVSQQAGERGRATKAEGKERIRSGIRGFREELATQPAADVPAAAAGVL